MPRTVPTKKDVKATFNVGKRDSNLAETLVRKSWMGLGRRAKRAVMAVRIGAVILLSGPLLVLVSSSLSESLF